MIHLTVRFIAVYGNAKMNFKSLFEGFLNFFSGERISRPLYFWTFLCKLSLSIRSCMANFKNVETNERIRDREIRVIDADGGQLGIMSARAANDLANQKNLDLVKISPTAVPPVCKIMDYGKFKFDTQKREKEAKRSQKVSELKEVWLSMTIDRHDLETKAKHARKFLSAGDKVKVSIRMRGRQQAHAKLGIQVMEDFFAICEDLSVMDKKPSTEGRSILMILHPKK